MAKNELYTQCLLQLSIDNKNRKETITWIPKDIAYKNNKLNLHGKPGWKIIETYSTIKKTRLNKFE